MNVTIQYRTTRKPYAWKTAFTGRVLFHDRSIVFVRGAGAHSMFWPEGSAKTLGWKMTHPAAKKIPHRVGGWRLHPVSVKRLKDASG